uniref:HGH1 protein n=1 Tax=Macrostomum lignano TaxID=282301 RepID=A0A1I8G8X3_9PLAT
FQALQQGRLIICIWSQEAAGPVFTWDNGTVRCRCSHSLEPLTLQQSADCAELLQATLATLVTSEVFADRRRCRLRRATSTGAASSGADSARWFEVHPGLSCVLVACGCRQHLQELDSLAALLAGAVRMFHSEEDPQVR